MVTNCVACYGHYSMFIISLYYQHSKDLSGFYWCLSVEGLMNLLLINPCFFIGILSDSGIAIWIVLLRNVLNVSREQGTKKIFSLVVHFPNKMSLPSAYTHGHRKHGAHRAPWSMDSRAGAHTQPSPIILKLHYSLLSHQQLNLQVINHDWYGASISSVGSAGVPCAEVLSSLQQPWARVRARPQVWQNTNQISWPSINPSRPLKSAGSGSLAVLRVKTKHGEAAFSFSAAQMWHKLPAEKHRLETMLLL